MGRMKNLGIEKGREIVDAWFGEVMAEESPDYHRDIFYNVIEPPPSIYCTREYICYEDACARICVRVCFISIIWNGDVDVTRFSLYIQK